ncbi:TolC family protein [Sphingoaurantiacus capsulatus]|uniref:TolC family protein n=1 Tax=Sphingoaurantiacus capsulatus TaxID=1771310 RepID=A0ABV7XAR4_9SPHN
MLRACLTAAVACATVAPAAAATFAQALRTVAENHPRLQAVDAIAAGGRADIDAAKAAWRPQVSLVGDTGWQRSGLTSRSDTAFLPGVRATQLVYDGGRTGADVAQRRYRAESLAVEHDRVLADLAQRLSDAYLEWSRQRALLAIADEQVVSLQRLETMVRQIAEFDRGRASDVALVSTRLAQSEAQRDARRIAISDARALIRQIAAAEVEPEGEMPSPDPFMPKSLDAALGALDTHPAVRIADLEISQAGAAVDAARAWWKPRLSLDAGSESESSLTGRTNLFGTVELKLRSTLSPIDGGGGSARLASAQANASAARLEARFTERNLRDEVVRHWTSVADRTPRLATLSALVETTDASSAVVGEQFKLGRRSILDLLSFEVERFSARTQLESERRDLLAAKYRLLAVTARLSPAFVPDAVAAPVEGGS